MDLIAFAKGKFTEIFQGELAAAGARATEPTDVTITVSAPAAIGDKTVQLRNAPGPLQLRKGLILAFIDGPDEVQLQVTADTVITASTGAVPVNRVTGEDDAGLDKPLSVAHVATWDQLHRVYGTESANFTGADQTNVMNPATYESKFVGAGWQEDEATSKSWTIPREGLFRGDDFAFGLVRSAWFQEREVWVKVVYTDPDGNPVELWEGRAKVRNLTYNAPAGDMVRASWTWNGQGIPKHLVLADPGS